MRDWRSKQGSKGARHFLLFNTLTLMCRPSLELRYRVSPTSKMNLLFLLEYLDFQQKQRQVGYRIFLGAIMLINEYKEHETCN